MVIHGFEPVFISSQIASGSSNGSIWVVLGGVINCVLYFLSRFLAPAKKVLDCAPARVCSDGFNVGSSRQMVGSKVHMEW